MDIGLSRHCVQIVGRKFTQEKCELFEILFEKSFDMLDFFVVFESKRLDLG